MGQADERRKAWTSYALVVAAVPAVFCLETLVRALFLADETRDVADLLGRALRRIAWVSFGVTVVFGTLSMLLRGVLRRRYQSGAAMMAGASIPQVPAILACSVGLLGADPLPVGLTVLASTLFVAWHWPARVLS